jgi:hypothetical protein
VKISLCREEWSVFLGIQPYCHNVPLAVPNSFGGERTGGRFLLCRAQSSHINPVDFRTVCPLIRANVGFALRGALLS